MWEIESDGSSLMLTCVMTESPYIVQRSPPETRYASPWGGEWAERLRQVAHYHEAQDINAFLENVEPAR